MADRFNLSRGEKAKRTNTIQSMKAILALLFLTAFLMVVPAPSMAGPPGSETTVEFTDFTLPANVADFAGAILIENRRMISNHDYLTYITIEPAQEVATSRKTLYISTAEQRHSFVTIITAHLSPSAYSMAYRCSQSFHTTSYLICHIASLNTHILPRIRDQSVIISHVIS